MTGGRVLLLGCGILQEEIRFLIRKNGWPLDTFFLDSALHVDLEKLAQHLKSALTCHAGRRIVVFFGACHPLMDQMLADAGTFRTAGQNCVEMLMGEKAFTEELKNGAFFLMEAWARRWDEIVSGTFGKNRRVIRDIFREDRKYLLCLRTPCSGDFSEEAREAGGIVDLPLHWRELSLDRLEVVLQAALTRIMRGE